MNAEPAGAATPGRPLGRDAAASPGPNRPVRMMPRLCAICDADISSIGRTKYCGPECRTIGERIARMKHMGPPPKCKSHWCKKPAGVGRRPWRKTGPREFCSSRCAVVWQQCRTARRNAIAADNDPDPIVDRIVRNHLECMDNERDRRHEAIEKDLARVCMHPGCNRVYIRRRDQKWCSRRCAAAGLRLWRRMGGRLCVRCGAYNFRQRSPWCSNLCAARGRRQKRVDMRVCTRCGKEPASPGYVSCRPCRKNARKTKVDRRNVLRAQGRCVDCGVGANGSRRCRPCKRKSKLTPGTAAMKKRWMNRHITKYGPQIPHKAIEQAWAAADHRCAECGRSNTALEVHHITPIASGGTHDLHNLETLCRACHARRHGYRRAELSA